MGNRIFATEIFGMDVRNEDGKKVGKLDDVVIDTQSGEIKFLLLKDHTDLCSRSKTDHEGRKAVSFSKIDINEENIVITLEF